MWKRNPESATFLLLKVFLVRNFKIYCFKIKTSTKKYFPRELLKGFKVKFSELLIPKKIDYSLTYLHGFTINCIK